MHQAAFKQVTTHFLQREKAKLTPLFKSITMLIYIKIKTKLSLRLYLSTTPLRRIGGVEVQLHAFLTSALDGGE